MKLLIEMIGIWGGYLLFIITLFLGSYFSYIFLWEPIIIFFSSEYSFYNSFPQILALGLGIFTGIFLAGAITERLISILYKFFDIRT